MTKLTLEKYRELFKLRAEGKLEPMECTNSLYSLLKPIFLNGMKILDVACGTGHYYKKLKELGDFYYYGIDLDKKVIAMAKEIWKNFPNIEFDIQNVKEMTLPDKSFDIVFCYNLLSHLEDYKDVVNELFRVSKKYILIRALFDKNINSVTFEDNVSNESYRTNLIYYNTYSRDNISEYLSNLGSCHLRFIPDNLKIPDEVLEKQAKLINVNAQEFTKGSDGKIQEWKGIDLNYEVLYVEKI